MGETRGAETQGTLEHLTVHTLSWLCLGNLVGLWLATLLLVPGLGGVLTFGRWMPLHLNIQLYGWCALPLVGLLYRLYLPQEPGRLPRWAVAGWSATLAFGCVAWAGGRVTGKLFLDWTGPARGLLMVNFVVLTVTLWLALRRRAREPITKAGLWLRGILLLGLSTVPVAMWQATELSTYQHINPESGGGTGANVLGAALFTVLLFYVLPWVLNRPSTGSERGKSLTIGVAMALHFGFFALIAGADRAHVDVWQVLAVASVLPWPVLLVIHLRRFQWSDTGRRWLLSAAGWAGLLVVSGFVAFLPGNFGGWKFTNALVAHAHLAMAGLLTSLCILILHGLSRRRALFADRPSFALWHGGLLLQLVVLTVLGAAEAAQPDLLFGANTGVQAAYGLRWLAGLAMLAGSTLWLRQALGAPQPVERVVSALDPAGPEAVPAS